jgi:hypothetical protein
LATDGSYPRLGFRALTGMPVRIPFCGLVGAQIKSGSARSQNFAGSAWRGPNGRLALRSLFSGQSSAFPQVFLNRVI